MASGLTFPILNPCISPYQLVVILNDFFLQIQTASTFNFDTFVTDGSFNGSQLTLNNNQGGTFNVSWNPDTFITGGTYDHPSSLITLNNSTGGTFDFSLSAITDELNSIQINAGNDFVTAGTYDYNSQSINFTRQSGGTFSTSLSSITNDLYSLSSLTSFDVTTGATYNPSNSTLNFETYTGGSYSVDVGALTGNTYVTGATVGTIFSHPNSLILTLNDGNRVWTSLSAFTGNETVTGGTYSSGTSLLSLTTNSGSTVQVDMSELANQVNTDDYVVSGVFNSGTSVMTLTTLSGNTVEITGVTQEDRHIFSGQVIGTSVMNFFGTNGYNFSIDVTSLSNAAMSLTSAVYSADSSSIVFYASSGGTAFVVDGISKITGGTYDSGSEQLNLFNSTGGTINIGGFLDNYITGATFNTASNDINLTDRSGNTVSVHIGSLTADTGVIAVQGGTNINTGGTQSVPIINLDNTITLSTVNASVGNLTTVNATNVNGSNGVFTTVDSVSGDFVNLDAAIILSAGTNLYDIFGSGGGGGTASSWQDAVTNYNIVYSGSPSISGTNLSMFNTAGSQYDVYIQENGSNGFSISSTTTNGNTYYNGSGLFVAGGTGFEDRRVSTGIDSFGNPHVLGRIPSGDGVLYFSAITISRAWTLPDQSGTIALTSDITGQTSTAPQVLTYSATTWLNVDNGYNAELTLTGDADLEIQNMTAGKYATVVIKQDGVGSHSITSLPAGSIVVNGQAGNVTVTANANAIDMFTIYYDGTNYFWNNGFNYT